MQAFRECVESGDFDAIDKFLAEDVVFTSPVVFKPYQGKAITAAILRGVGRIFEDFRYIRQIVDGADSVLVFTTTVNGKQLTGCDLIHVNDDGLIDDFMVMVRPLSGAQALQQAMAAQFDQISQEASA